MSSERFTVNIPEQETCSICLETLHGTTTIIIEPCKHMIHLACLDMQRKCPLCRNQLPNPLSHRDNIDNRNRDNRNRDNIDAIIQNAMYNPEDPRDNVRNIEYVTKDVIYYLRHTPFAANLNSYIDFNSKIQTFYIRSNQFFSGLFIGAYKFFIDMQQGDRYFDIQELIKIGYGDLRRTGKKSIAMFQEKFDQLNSNAKITLINTMKFYVKPADTKDKILELFVTESNKLSHGDNTKKEKGLQLANEFANALFP